MNSKMKIEEHKIPVREVFDGYVDSAELGVRGYGGKLNIRPAFQREFVYKPAQRDAVIETVRHLSIRRFSDKMARTAYERQGGKCVRCGKKFAIEEMQADHITPWAKGGKTVAENCQMLCADCNRRKSDV